MKITFEEALNIAQEDYCTGVIAAIDTLTNLGGNTKEYYDWLNQSYENDTYDDETNLNMRDKIYKLNGISKIMKKAYDQIWNK